MSNSDYYLTNKSKQDRSRVRVEKILDAAEELAANTPSQKISIKSIAKKAFISVGAIYHHFPSINSIFASLLIRKVRRRLNSLITLLEGLGPEMTLDMAANSMLDQVFAEWNQKPIAAKKETLSLYYQNASKPEFFSSYSKVLYPYVRACIERNTTGTMRDISEEEWPFFNRTSLTAIIAPFVEANPIAGTDAHKAIAKDIVLRIYSK
ncbi:TetR/AcrR family transcriptional regulator [Polynucleobacter paneuropaeus]|uniref:TetR/AcrR family transcriptional regulator n=1 Tax=Polynucleobacter paneuropaeus TaxID=2527775 RepID=UPI001BFD04A5|nr:TetR/AcrR family transcriptional regulator [Polynucleobacter paneuropaeus]MBT8527772.1 TetR/AcrR family transcriptional regulator [Polynucleobacter paneuropaeus]MBT8534386.1 TetR/AcrR family transcriptional regulator [Polynucleobacter paneuropaeus]MBT8635498.1 TetR/AcrR family transcriptional regulator [Polynucleobacter paneuropaeus]QWD52156.1 TetR/AcrR family transcriptional regulator [Polynucleobacter paneuropaeus]QWD53772.1 TetR/AcrR family transcriptional regulator [Polynucleobacter pan